MEELLQYILTGVLDNAKLLELLINALGNKTFPLINQMLRNIKVRDTHIRYQIWKLLGDDHKKQFTQNLEKVGQAIIKEIKKQKPEKPKKEKPQEPKEVETNPPAEHFLTMSEEQAQTELRTLVNQANKLANTLNDYRESDDAGRKLVVDQLNEIEAKIIEYKAYLEGGAAPSHPKPQDYDFIISDQEIYEMDDMQKKAYKTILAQKRTRAKTNLANNPTSKKAKQWQEIIDIVDSLYQKIG